MENENELEKLRSDEGRKRERTLLNESWGQEVGLNGDMYIVNLGVVSGKRMIERGQE